MYYLFGGIKVVQGIYDPDELDPFELLEQECDGRLGISSKEFLEKYRRGDYKGTEDLEVQKVIALVPLLDGY